MFKELFESDLPKLESSRDVKDFIEYLYNTKDGPDYEDYLHIIKSFKKYPMFMDPKGLKFSRGKYESVIGTEKTGLKRKFAFEFEDNYLHIYQQTKKGQRQNDFEF